MEYLIIKWLHILAAITAFGANITYGIWLSRAMRQPESLAFTLRTIKVVDDRLANPAYGFGLVTGLVLVFLADWSLTHPWLLTSLVLYGLVFVLGAFGYSPALRRQIKTAEALGPHSPEYVAVARRGNVVGIALAALVLAILFLMVTKPSLWA